MKAAVLLANGVEEAESVTIVDFLRRAAILCTTFSVDEREITGMQGICFFADEKLNDSIFDYDMLVVPGGRESIVRFQADPKVLEILQRFNEEGKWVCAMCSGTRMLEAGDVIQRRRVTGYTGYEEQLKSGVFTDRIVERDGNLITSQGPATAYPFAFALIEAFGQDTMTLKERLMYSFAKGV